MTFLNLRPLMCGVLVLFMSTPALTAETVSFFESGDLQGWKEKSFEGKTTYDLGDEVINAQCNGAASSLYMEKSVDLDKTPYLHWSWQASSQTDLGNVEEREKGGDDFAARIYAVVNTGRIIPHVLTLNYVWSQNEEVGSSWPNPFYDKAMMVVINNRKDDDRFLSNTRNVKEDFMQYFGKDIAEIDGIALMTDCDNTGGQARATYGAVYFSSDATE